MTRWYARFRGRRLACSVGRGGIRRDKREGDGATPEGIYGLPAVFYRPDRIPVRQVPRGSIPIKRFHVWCDDQDCAEYNRFLDRKSSRGRRHERLFRADRLYDLFALVSYNWPEAVPGRGSAIFLHAWRSPRHPTAGCVAFRPKDLRWIVRCLTLRTKLSTMSGSKRLARDGEIAGIGK